MAFDTIETPSGRAEKVLGGSGNFFSIAASFFSPVQVIGVVGEDFPKEHLNWLSQRQIDVSGVEIVPGKTFHWVGSYNENLNEARTISTALNVFEHFNPKLSAGHKAAKYVFLANIDPVLQNQVLNQMPRPNLVACDSMNFWITSKLDALKETLKKVDILSINEGESAMLSGEKNLLKAAKIIRGMGPSVLVIKRGEYGALLFTESGIFHAPAYPLEMVVDPTGAGDTFAGAFMGYLADSGIDREVAKSDPKLWETTLRKAVLAGCVMASFTVEDFSIQRLVRLTKSELVDRQKAMTQMLTIG
ncbi:MAG: sugar kinase [Bdellovibrionales bacterium]|nr:sugar kinase [Bdellovibrionales bacterium]